MKRSEFDHPELDYLQLVQELKDYSFPRDRITKLLASGELIRVKKGIYVDPHSDLPYSKEILANLIYGPSYVSLEYALSYHNLIPEAVRVVTSVTTGRKKRYQTPIGEFDYSHMPERFFSIGAEYFPLENGRGFMMAGPEKSLFDLLYLRYSDVVYPDIGEHLFENLRIDENSFWQLDFAKIEPILEACNRRSIVALRRFIESAGRKSEASVSSTRDIRIGKDKMRQDNG
ncbi:MAG TPA: hypothetical protein PKJ53_07100 [Spirochaetales bacterium]|nr:hypothetical protein [Spirochaetales bacterium]